MYLRYSHKVFFSISEIRLEIDALLSDSFLYEFFHEISLSSKIALNVGQDVAKLLNRIAAQSQQFLCHFKRNRKIGNSAEKHLIKQALRRHVVHYVRNERRNYY